MRDSEAFTAGSLARFSSTIRDMGAKIETAIKFKKDERARSIEMIAIKV